MHAKNTYFDAVRVSSRMENGDLIISNVFRELLKLYIIFRRVYRRHSFYLTKLSLKIFQLRQGKYL